MTDKLGMTVGFSLEELEASREPARPYMMQADTRLPALRIPIRTTASGAMTTSIADFANWMRLHLGKGELDGERLLPPALIGELHAPRVYVPLQSPYAEFGDAHYGLGFQCIGYRGDRLVWHGGGWRRLEYADDAGAGFWDRHCGLHQPQPERRHRGADLLHHRPDARPRSGRMARALPSATRKKRSRISRPARTFQRRRATPTHGRRMKLRPMRATTSIPPTA